MPKIKIKVTIQNNNYKTNAIIREDSISYQEEDQTRVNYNYRNNILIRENNNIKMEYDFLNKNGKILLKDLNKVLEIKIKVNKIKKENYNIEIEYEIENENINYRIEEIK